jgi:putative tryptophan/tyrosine transport system substrate-binding protein
MLPSELLGADMRRRQFMKLLGGLAAAWPLVARSQQPAKMKRIAMVASSLRAVDLVASYRPFLRAFFEELSRAGFVEGRSLVVERYSALGQFDRVAQVARDIVDTRPDAIFSTDIIPALAVKAATTTIPIVAISGDPVALGLVSNIARPGGNITGSAVNAGFEIWGKRFGLLKEVLPMLSNACIILHRRLEWEGPYGSAIRRAAKDASVALKETVFDGKIDETEYQRVFSAFEQDRPDALIVSKFSVHFTNRATIVELAAKQRLPAIYAFRDFVEIGGLMAYAPDFSEVGRSAGHQMAQILNGTNPGDIPYNQVTHYELGLNLKTAKSLDLEFPATLLSSADFVVE